MSGTRAAVGMSEAERKLFNALRQRPLGATLGKVADIAEVSERHARRVLRRFEVLGIATVREAPVRDGHRHARKPLWQLSYSPECIRLLGALPRQRCPMPPMPVDGAIPPQFWHLFWSGSQGHELDLNMPSHEFHAAGAMIASQDLAAEAWALRNLSTEVLQKLVNLRGYDKVDVNALIRSELEERARVAA